MNGFGIGEFLFRFDLMKKIIILSFLCFFAIRVTSIQAQEVAFENEVKRISAKYDSLGWSPGGTVFTGSSTIRMWSSLEETFSEENLINTGFGGSKASDLEQHLFPLVIKFEPSRVFIYEGDNDLWANVEVASILTSLDNIVTRIHLIYPNTEIFLIGAKPSPSRWEKKANYQIFNQMLSEYCRAKENVEFVDVWQALTNSDGSPRPELYLKDQLHLNAEGYQIWAGIFNRFF